MKQKKSKSEKRKIEALRYGYLKGGGGEVECLRHMLSKVKGECNVCHYLCGIVRVYPCLAGYSESVVSYHA